jgi:hypothetical protein
MCLFIVEEKFSFFRALKNKLVRNNELSRIIETIFRSGSTVGLLCIFRRALIAPNLKPSGGALKIRINYRNGHPGARSNC